LSKLDSLPRQKLHVLLLSKPLSEHYLKQRTLGLPQKKRLHALLLRKLVRSRLASLLNRLLPESPPKRPGSLLRKRLLALPLSRKLLELSLHSLPKSRDSQKRPPRRPLESLL